MRGSIAGRTRFPGLWNSFNFSRWLPNGGYDDRTDRKPPCRTGDQAAAPRAAGRHPCALCAERRRSPYLRPASLCAGRDYRVRDIGCVSADRTWVVQGKRVLVSEALGGGSITKKKK